MPGVEVTGDRDQAVWRTAITDRDSAALATAYGFETFADLVNDIPNGSEVIDLGSGLSNLGHEIAANRPDIEWIDLDARYEDPKVLTEVMLDAPDNLAFAALNALDIAELRGVASFDRIFSYFLFPHVRNQAGEKFEEVCRGVLDLVKEGGKLSIGPLKRGPDEQFSKSTAPIINKGLAIGQAVFSAYDSSITVCPVDTGMSSKEIASELEQILW